MTTSKEIYGWGFSLFSLQFFFSLILWNSYWAIFDLFSALSSFCVISWWIFTWIRVWPCLVRHESTLKFSYTFHKAYITSVNRQIAHPQSQHKVNIEECRKNTLLVLQLAVIALSSLIEETVTSVLFCIQIFLHTMTKLTNLMQFNAKAGGPLGNTYWGTLKDLLLIMNFLPFSIQINCPFWKNNVRVFPQ